MTPATPNAPRQASARLLMAATLLLSCAPAAAQDTAPAPGDRETMWIISPLFGYNRDTLKRRDHTGQLHTASRTAPEYGLFALAAHPRLVVNNFLFFTEAANDTKVMGNFSHANLYGHPASAITWNIGAGYMYHKIEPRNEEIKVRVPIAKLGPVLRFAAWGLTVSPYVGHAWERVTTSHGKTENDSYLYGITMDWRWRMVNFNAKYYYQDSREGGGNFNNVHLRLIAGITRHWGAVLRLDSKEHTASDDTSVLIGPVYVF